MARKTKKSFWSEVTYHALDTWYGRTATHGGFGLLAWLLGRGGRKTAASTSTNSTDYADDIAA